jgi:hypothetical protein
MNLSVHHCLPFVVTSMRAVLCGDSLAPSVVRGILPLQRLLLRHLQCGTLESRL